jgi:hypothetical protein
MDASTALARLRAMTASDTDPTLSDSELMLLLGMCQLEDEDGLAPDDVDWTGTYNLNLGAAEGWRWKAGKCSNRFAFRDDLNDYQRQQVHDACLKMVKEYRGKVAISALVRSPLYDPDAEEEDDE